MSIAGGLHRAVERALSVDATALQVFVKSARQWAGRPLEEADAETFRRRLGESGLAPHTLAHASYLPNLATPDRALRERSIEALGEEIARCERLGVPYLVLHPGSHMGSGEKAGLDRLVAGLDRLLAGRRRRSGRRIRAQVRVLLETTAGQGTQLGHRFEQLAFVIERARCAERLGVCFDTCHCLAAGYEFRDRATYRRTLRDFARTIGLERLRAFHLNDSRHTLGSRRDRHEHIGRGEVGLEAFRLLLNDRRFRELPMVLETAKGEDLAEDRMNLAVLREMLPKGRR